MEGSSEIAPLPHFLGRVTRSPASQTGVLATQKDWFVVRKKVLSEIHQGLNARVLKSKHHAVRKQRGIQDKNTSLQS